VLREYLTRRRREHRTNPASAPQTGHGLVSLRSAVIFAIATAAALGTGLSTQPEFGITAWIATVIGLNTIIDRDRND